MDNEINLAIKLSDIYYCPKPLLQIRVKDEKDNICCLTNFHDDVLRMICFHGTLRKLYYSYDVFGGYNDGTLLKFLHFKSVVISHKLSFPL